MSTPWQVVTGRDGVTRIKSTIGIWGEGMTFGFFLTRKEAILATVKEIKDEEETLKFYEEFETTDPQASESLESICDYSRNKIKKYREALDYARRRL